MEGQNLNADLFKDSHPQEKKDICVQMVSGLKYLFDNGIFHRDLKRNNIMFYNKFQPGGLNNKIMFIDFGYAEYFGNEHKFNRCYCGTVGYLCPWLMTQKGAEKCENYDHRVDLYS